MRLCEDCEIAPATVERVDSEGGAYHVCGGCDPGPGCRPLVKEGRYSNGRPMFYATCPQCGWTQVGTSESKHSASIAAHHHAELTP